MAEQGKHTAGEMTVHRYTGERPKIGLMVEGRKDVPVALVVPARSPYDLTTEDDANAARLALCWNMHDGLTKACHDLGMLALQSPRYSTDGEFQEAVDVALATAADAKAKNGSK